VLTVDDYGAIRRAHRDGMPIKQVVGLFGHSRNTIRKILRQSEPQPIPQTRNRTAPVLGPLHDVIDQILADDHHAPPKQRHTAMQVFRRLRDEHGYSLARPPPAQYLGTLPNQAFSRGHPDRS
jgi:transposase